MKITIEPTEIMYDQVINGVPVPVRIWKGHSAGGVPIEAYVLAITPDHKEDKERLKAELPSCMKPSAQTFDSIGPSEPGYRRGVAS